MAAKYLIYIREAGEAAAEDPPTSLAQSFLRDPLNWIGVRRKTNQCEA